MNQNMKLDSDTEWIYCPLCEAKTRIKIHSNTVATKMPIYCRKCNTESLVDIKNMVVKLSSEPDASTPSR